MQIFPRSLTVIATAFLLAACGEETGGSPASAEDAPVTIKEMAESEAKKVVNVAGTPTGKDFSIEKAKIVFEVEIGKTTGTKTAWVADWGDTVALHIDQVSFGMPEKKYVLWKDGRNTLYDLTKPDAKPYSSGLRMRDTELSLYLGASEKKLETAQMERVGYDEAAGKTCTLYRSKIADTEICRWNGIDIIYRSTVAGKLDVHAVEIEEGAEIPAEIRAIAE